MIWLSTLGDIRLDRILSDDKLNKIIVKDVNMKNYTTFKTGGVAKYAAFPDSVAEVQCLVKKLNEYNIGYIVLGNGSNVLVADKGINEFVIFLTELKGIAVYGNVIEVLSGNMMSEVAKTAQRNSLSGMEFMAGIPGTVGGGIYMNAGAYGGEIKDIIESVKCIDKNGEIVEYHKDDLHMSYRKSRFFNSDEIIVSAAFRLISGDKDVILGKMKEYNQSRREKQPLNYPNAGSTFKRPDGYFAGKLIEDAGLKGYRIGGAMVSEKHCGFLINYDNATSDDIYRLILYVQKTVYDKFGVLLEPEVKLIGEF